MTPAHAPPQSAARRAGSVLGIASGVRAALRAVARAAYRGAHWIALAGVALLAVESAARAAETMMPAQEILMALSGARAVAFLIVAVALSAKAIIQRRPDVACLAIGCGYGSIVIMAMASIDPDLMLRLQFYGDTAHIPFRLWLISTLALPLGAVLGRGAAAGGAWFAHHPRAARAAVLSLLILAIASAGLFGSRILEHRSLAGALLDGMTIAAPVYITWGPVLVIAQAAALIAALWPGRRVDRFDRWMIVALALSAAGTYLLLSGGSITTRGAYMAQVLDTLLAVTLGWAVMAELVVLHTQANADSARLSSVAQRDPLTGLANRRTLDAALAMRVAHSRLQGAPLGLVMVDIDHFKKINDTFGHLVGDETLQAVAAELGTHARRNDDVAARYGGEEFTLLLPNTDVAGTLEVAERLRAGVEALGLKAATGGPVTISVGVACAVAVSDDDAPVYLRRADAALYHAKRTGRNRVCLWDAAIMQPPVDVDAGGALV